MRRSLGERVADVRRLVDAARRVHADRARIAPEIARATRLSPEGVELGFASLERDASDDELRALAAGAGDAGHVHVILSANVFVAPLRAIALARAAADRVTVRASPRDPVLARELVAAAGDEAIGLVDERDAAATEADAIHVYGRDETIADVRARARGGVVVRGHGAGLGVAVVTRTVSVDDAAAAVAADVVPFDQRGCLSPRVALVEGDAVRAGSFAEALHRLMYRWGQRVPRGSLSRAEREEATRWRSAMSFAGRLWMGDGHAVALAPADAPLAIPPAGRAMLVIAVSLLDGVASRLKPLAPFIVAVGCDDPARVAHLAPLHARLSPLGRMQHPPFDGPVDLR